MFAGKRRAFLLYHRRAGKDIACWNFTINVALSDRAGLYFYVLPTYTQGKRVIWDGIDEMGNKLLHAIPTEMLGGKLNATEMKIPLINGSLIQIVGAENYDALRGTNPKGIVFSEYAMQDPRAWTEVISPILAKNDGWAVFNTTPLGKNHAFDLWSMATHSERWFTQKLTIADTGLIPRHVIEAEIAEGKGEEVIQQEYYCSFDRGVDGTYYGRFISAAWDSGRICSVPYDTSLDVHTSWDLGIGDATAIWFYQQTSGGEIHFIDFYENTGEGLAHYVQVLRDRDYLYGKHNFPHDVVARELGSGASREEQLRKLGIKVRVVQKLGIDDGIQAVRSVLPRCWFDKAKCAVGIKHLENYRKAFSNKLRCFIDRPLHDEHSDACFVAGTKIKTAHGYMEIENLRIGDLVQTPNGLNKITETYVHTTNVLYEVSTSNRRIVCTGNHKIFTKEGLVYADALRYNDTLLTIGDKFKCQMFGFLGKAKGLGFRDTCLYRKMRMSSILMGIVMFGTEAITKKVNRIRLHFQIFIGQYGRGIMEKFQMGTMFITKTGTQEITISKTWKRCRVGNITNSMTVQRGESAARSQYCTPCSTQKSGILAQRVESGTKRMEKTSGRQEKKVSLASVECVTNLSSPISTTPSIAAESANKNGAISLALISWREVAQFVKACFPLINTGESGRVLKIARLPRQTIQKVYDIEVEREHCYYANDILVSNSDSLRYAAVSISKSGRSGMTEADADKMSQRYGRQI